MNRVTLLGRLGQQADLRTTAGGQSVANFRLAVSERYRSKDDGPKERTDWITCVMWGRAAEAVAPHLSKGRQVLVEGSLRARSYEAKDGGKRYVVEVNVNDLHLVGGKPAASLAEDGGTSDDAPAPTTAAPREYAQRGFDEHLYGSSGSDDEIPF